MILLIEFEGLVRVADGCIEAILHGPLTLPLDDLVEFQFYEGARGGSAVLIGDSFDDEFHHE